MLKVKNVGIYSRASGVKPLYIWLATFDRPIAARIVRNIERLDRGILGDWKNLGEGLFELRIHFRPGYRIYFTSA